MWGDTSTRPVEFLAAAAQACGPSSDVAHARAGARWCPEEEASWFSRLTFAYVEGLLRKGQTKALVMDDLWDVAEGDGAASVAARFQVRGHLQQPGTPPAQAPVRACGSLACPLQAARAPPLGARRERGGAGRAQHELGTCSAHAQHAQRLHALRRACFTPAA